MKHSIRIFGLLAVALFLFACGGGGEPLERTNNGNTPTPPVTPSEPVVSLSLSMVNAEGDVSTQVDDGSPLTLRATLSDQDGNTINNELVTFSFNQPGLARFDNDTGTALTNENGVASINIYAEALAGSGTISATIDAGASDDIGFTSTGTRQQEASSLELFANIVQLPSSGSDSVELIAVVKNDKNILLNNIPMTFSADQNASLSSVDLSTGEDGTARALLSTQNDPENRVITVVATTGDLSQEINISVVGTEINVNGASSIIIDDVSPITIIVSDSDGVGIANQDIILSTDLGALSTEIAKTGANGQVTVEFSSSVSGEATITASALNASTSFNVEIQQDDFSFVDLPTQEIELNAPEDISLRWFKNSTPFANGDIVVTASRGTISVNGADINTTTTDSDGIAVIQIQSAFAGPASISAVGTDSDGETVTARATIEFIATEPNSIAVDATPDLIGPEGQTSTITAIVRDSAGNLVKGSIVDFTIVADSTGGSISPNTATTDSNGIASTVYTSNAVSSENGILIRAFSGNAQGETALTVGDRAFDISLGTGNLIQSPDDASYLKEFAVFVTDAAGRPVNDADLTASGTPSLRNAYRKGFWLWNTDENVWQTFVTAVCDSEDSIIEANNRLDMGEDLNDDGQLTPGNVATVSFKDGVARTNEFGQATIEIRYAKQFAPWVTIDAKVFGQSLGTESSEFQRYTLTVAADDLTERSTPPPPNPFGQSANCNDLD
ncbi:Ig-like domain-containing protein [Agaribacter marinus]|uniref:Big-1 domain-containing protein n=1 Tax=Agaribacter marinus TaxID=1431249 RepID=A0AA37SVD1_9ALTE|nr:Ig-like domain-containing protein [Agaribacter marinus]GLR70153.1 hypothetical protein GCM10007852_10610 [Agaribacter marinus]